MGSPSDAFARNSVAVKRASGGEWQGVAGDFTIDTTELERRAAQVEEAKAQIEKMVHDLTGQTVEVETFEFPMPPLEIPDHPVRYKPFRYEQMVVKFKQPSS